MSNNNEKIVQEIVSSSGNPFHVEVIKFLRSDGWKVQVSPYYVDRFQDKPREIDIVAENFFIVSGNNPSRRIGTINVRMYIECKNIPTHTVFWFDEKDRQKAERLVMKSTGLPSASKDLAIQKNHFFQYNPLTHSVAKLFSTARGQDTNTEKEFFYKALTQCLNAYVTDTGSSLFNTNEQGNLKILQTIKLPIILCKNFDNLYACDFEKSEPKKIKEKFQFEIEYSYPNLEGKILKDYFLVDVVDFHFFIEYLQMIFACDIEPLINYKLDQKN